MLALHTGVEIVPVAILGTRRILPKGGWRIRPGPIILRFGRPIATEGYGEERRNELMAEVRARIQAMLDEPASGLSRGERERLTELLLALPREVTLVLIEHDRDVALRVAERVTMMHDGRKIVEGTPDEIRANETVHELYLGGRVTDEGIEAGIGSADAGENVAERRSRGESEGA